MRGIIVAVIIAVVAIVIVVPAAILYQGFAPFLDVKDEIDSMDKSSGEILTIADMLKKGDVAMAFVEANPDGYDEIFEETFVGSYTYMITSSSGALEIEYEKDTDTITSQIYTCTDS
ncbi:MAG: hypothetical protein EB829_04500, partial [Nitrosopumilus sp. H8]